MPQGMEVPLVFGKPGQFAVVLHQVVQHHSLDRCSSVADEQLWRAIVTRSHIAFADADFIRLDGVGPGSAALQPMDRDPQALEIHIIDLQQADFAGSEAVAIGGHKNGFIPLIISDSDQALQLIRGEELDSTDSILHCEGFGVFCSALRTITVFILPL
jgi:hypothetical protein